VTFLFTYENISGTWVDGTITFKTTGDIEIGQNLDDDPFPNGSGVSDSHNRAYTYVVIFTPLP
jgi:hypothetical protein